MRLPGWLSDATPARSRCPSPLLDSAAEPAGGAGLLAGTYAPAPARVMTTLLTGQRGASADAGNGHARPPKGTRSPSEELLPGGRTVGQRPLQEQLAPEGEAQAGGVDGPGLPEADRVGVLRTEVPKVVREVGYGPEHERPPLPQPRPGDDRVVPRLLAEEHGIGQDAPVGELEQQLARPLVAVGAPQGGRRLEREIGVGDAARKVGRRDAVDARRLASGLFAARD